MMSKYAWSPGRIEPVGEHVRVRAAPLAGDRVDRLDELRPHLEQPRVRQRHDVALADAGLQDLEDVLVHAVDHRAGLGQQHDLVRALDLAGVGIITCWPSRTSIPASLQLEEHRRSRRRRRRAACRATPSSFSTDWISCDGALLQADARADRRPADRCCRRPSSSRRTGAAAAGGAPSPPSRSPRSAVAPSASAARSARPC